MPRKFNQVLVENKLKLKEFPTLCDEIDRLGRFVLVKALQRKIPREIASAQKIIKIARSLKASLLSAIEEVG